MCHCHKSVFWSVFHLCVVFMYFFIFAAFNANKFQYTSCLCAADIIGFKL